MDGPRLNNKSDENEILEIQKFLDNSINWQCKINKIYSKVNLGLKKRIISGINEVFNNDDNAIVLEDDCLPHNDFFYFCESILEKYKNHKKVRFITGNNFQKKIINTIMITISLNIVIFGGGLAQKNCGKR